MLADETAIDWPAVEGAIRPDGVDPDRWDAVFATLRDRLGMTWASYLSVLVEENARRLRGNRTTCLGCAWLCLGMKVAEIYAAADGAVVGYVALAETSDPLPGFGSPARDRGADRSLHIPHRMHRAVSCSSSYRTAHTSSVSKGIMRMIEYVRR